MGAVRTLVAGGDDDETAGMMGDRNIRADFIHYAINGNIGSISIQPGSEPLGRNVLSVTVDAAMSLLREGELAEARDAFARALKESSDQAATDPKLLSRRYHTLYMFGVASYHAGQRRAGRDVVGEAASWFRGQTDVGAGAESAEGSPSHHEWDTDLLGYARCLRFIARANLELGQDLELAHWCAETSLALTLDALKARQEAGADECSGTEVAFSPSLVLLELRASLETGARLETAVGRVNGITRMCETFGVEPGSDLWGDPEDPEYPFR